MFELERGSFEYIKKKKKKHMSAMLLQILAGVIIFVIGLLLNKYDKANICTVVAILMVLPAAKHLVEFIVMFPYKSVTRERYDKVMELAGENAVVMTDMVITSPEKVMDLDFVIITDNQVLGLIGKKGQDAGYIEKYLKDSLKNNGLEEFTVKIFEDEDKFIKCIPEKSYESTKLQEECFLYVRTLGV